MTLSVTKILQSNYYEKERWMQRERDGFYEGVAMMVSVNPRISATRFWPCFGVYHDRQFWRVTVRRITL